MSHKEIVLSAPAEANVFEYCANYTSLTESVCPLKVYLIFSQGMSNSLQVESIEPLTTKFPRSCHDTDHTGWICESNVAMHEAFKKSQILMVLSPEHVAKWEPFG